MSSNLDSTKKLKIPSFPNPQVSIIIPVFNNWDINYSCIKSIIENTGESIPYEIIIADDCSSDNTKDCTSIIENIIHLHKYLIIKNKLY